VEEDRELIFNFLIFSDRFFRSFFSDRFILPCPENSKPMEAG